MQGKRRKGAAQRSGRGAQSRVLRIIAGAWRGRKLRFPDIAAIRPTPDRVRETLFNWLAPQLQGARCLDLFAGSGALGLEALSRGAAHVTFVERDGTAARALEDLIGEWQAPGAEVVRSEALEFLRSRPAVPCGIVFLDPPFESGLLRAAAAALESAGWLAPGAFIYLEAPARAGLPELPSGWAESKAKRSGEVGYHLFRSAADRAAIR